MERDGLVILGVVEQHAIFEVDIFVFEHQHLNNFDGRTQNNTDLEEAKRRVVAFLDGECAVSDSVDMEAYSAELREVLNELK